MVAARFGETIAATRWVTVSVVKPHAFVSRPRNARPIPRTHTTKKSASGFVRASVSSNEKQNSKRDAEENTVIPSEADRAVERHEPKLTVIADYTIAYKPASDWKICCGHQHNNRRPTAMSSG